MNNAQQNRGAGRHVAFQAGAPQAFDVDYVVAGSGAGGAAAAITLARAGHSVALVEAGPWRDPQDYPTTMYGTMRDMFADWGQMVAMGNMAKGAAIMPIVQAKLMGGTPVINSAIVVRTPGDVLQDWRERLGLGDVFTENAIGLAQDRIENELEVTETPAPIMGQTGGMMLQALHKRGMEGHAIHRSVRGTCEGAMQCLQGCKRHNKRTANITWIPELKDKYHGLVLSCAPVDKVLIEKGHAVGVQGRWLHPDTRHKGAQFTIRAKKGVLVATSATQSAPLLQRSGVKLPALGQGWRAHPGSGVVGVYPHEVDMHKGPSQGVASLHHRKDIGIKLEHLSLPLELFAARVGGAGQTLTQKLADYRRCAMWVTAVRAEAVGTVKQNWLGNVDVQYQPTKRDIERLRTGAKIIAEMHFSMGAEKVWPGIVGLPSEIGPDQLGLIDNAPLDNRSYTWVLSHLFGGCTLGNDPQTSVVAPDLHVRGVRNLHVVDASAIPTTLGVNPQHTIMAMAMVTADRIMG